MVCHFKLGIGVRIITLYGMGDTSKKTLPFPKAPLPVHPQPRTESIAGKALPDMSYAGRIKRIKEEAQKEGVVSVVKALLEETVRKRPNTTHVDVFETVARFYSEGGSCVDISTIATQLFKELGLNIWWDDRVDCKSIKVFMPGHSCRTLWPTPFGGRRVPMYDQHGRVCGFRGGTPHEHPADSSDTPQIDSHGTYPRPRPPVRIVPFFDC